MLNWGLGKPWRSFVYTACAAGDGVATKVAEIEDSWNRFPGRAGEEGRFESDLRCGHCGVFFFCGGEGLAVFW